MLNPLQFVEGYAKGTLSKEELSLLDEFPNTKKAAILRKKELDAMKLTDKRTTKKRRI